jgi:hypothetical protein
MNPSRSPFGHKPVSVHFEGATGDSSFALPSFSGETSEVTEEPHEFRALGLRQRLPVAAEDAVDGAFALAFT